MSVGPPDFVRGLPYRGYPCCEGVSLSLKFRKGLSHARVSARGSGKILSANAKTHVPTCVIRCVPAIRVHRERAPRTPDALVRVPLQGHLHRCPRSCWTRWRSVAHHDGVATVQAPGDLSMGRYGCATWLRGGRSATTHGNCRWSASAGNQQREGGVKDGLWRLRSGRRRAPSTQPEPGCPRRVWLAGGRRAP